MTTSASMTGASGARAAGAESLLVERSGKVLTVTLNRPAQRNSISPELVGAFNRALDEVQRDPSCRMIVIQGRDRIFCTGLDFESTSRQFAGQLSTQVISAYMDLMMRLAEMPQVVVAKVEGLALAGGLGCVAASDIVIADHRSEFGLSEALWGLLPACVAPFLIRRVGYQNAYRMTLTAEMIAAPAAHALGLVDILSENPGDEIRKQLLRVSRVENETIADAKRYFSRFAPVDGTVAEAAIAETTRLLNSTRVRENIQRYVDTKQFPWER